MSREGSAAKIRLSSFDDLFGGAPEKQAAEPIVEIPLNELHEFKGHPFRVLDDEKMEEAVESVKQYGVLVPGIARPRPEGGYEIISGHRRRRASELAGKTTMPFFVREYSDDEAVIVMVDSNIQREHLLVSEKAKAYAMKYEAAKHQGRAGGRSLEVLGEESGESGKTIQRYIYLSRLSDELLAMVDNKQLGIMQGVNISFLPAEYQYRIYQEINATKAKISVSQSKALRFFEINPEDLTFDRIHELLSDNSGQQKPQKPADSVSPLPSDTTEPKPDVSFAPLEGQITITDFPSFVPANYEGISNYALLDVQEELRKEEKMLSDLISAKIDAPIVKKTRMKVDAFRLLEEFLEFSEKAENQDG